MRQLMMAYKDERRVNEKLREELAACQAKLLATDENLQRLSDEFQRLKTARMIEVSGEDIKMSRARITKLIREVDKCIALLDI
ncbi:hypothetical protein EVA_10431 [gut metagenome]|uniref:Uncharacterized protein n=1 Tax=gut metagenome TaxID=749906 RepID=J9GNI4_9ZZZZ